MRKYVIALSCAFSLSPPALASQQSGPVVMVSSASGGAPSGFTVTGTRTAKPACATDDIWMIPSPSGDGSKAVLAQILSAYLAGRNVLVFGTGTCTVFTNREDVAYVNLQ